MRGYELIHHETRTGVQAIEITSGLSTWLTESIIKKYKSIVFVYNVASSTYVFSAWSEVIPREWFDINNDINHALSFDHNNVVNTSLVAGSLKSMIIFGNYQVTYFYGYKQMYSDETAAGLTHHIYFYGIK